MDADWPWTPDDTGMDDDDAPCAYCGEAGCEDTCTGALLAREEDEDEEASPHAAP